MFRRSVGLCVKRDVLLFPCPRVRFFHYSIDDQLQMSRLLQDRVKILMEPQNNKHINPKHFDFVAATATKKDHKTMLELYSRMKDLTIRPNRKFYHSLLQTAPTKSHLQQLCVRLVNQPTLPSYIYRTIANQLACHGLTMDIVRIIDIMKSRDEPIDIFMYNILLKSANVSGDTDIIDTIVREIELDKIEFDVYSYNTIISGYSRKQQFDMAWKYIGKMAKSPSGVSLNAFLSLFEHLSKANNMDKVIELLKRGLPLTPEQMASVIHRSLRCVLRGKSEESEYAWKILSIAREKNVANIRLYTDMITHFIHEKNHAKVQKVMSSVSEDQIETDAIYYTSVLNYYFHEVNFPQFKQIFTEAMVKKLAFDWPPYRTALIFYITNGEAASFFQLMEQDTSSCKKTLSNAYSKLIAHYCTENQVSSAYAILSKMKERKIPRHYKSYRPLLEYYGRIKDDAGLEVIARDILDEENIDRRKASNHIFITLCSQDAHADLTSIVESMKNMNFKPCLNLFHSLVDEIIEKRGMTLEQYRYLRDEMKRENILPDRVWYEKILTEFCKQGLIDHAMNMITGDMEEDGATPSRKMYFKLLAQIALMRGCGSHVLKIQEQILQFSSTVQTKEYYMLFTALMKQRMTQEAEKLLEVMENRRDKPSLAICNTLVLGYITVENINGAFNIINNMKSKGISPDWSTYKPIFYYLQKVNNPVYVKKLNIMMEVDGLSDVMQKLSSGKC